MSAIRLFFAYVIGKPGDKDDSAPAAADTEAPGADAASAPVAGTEEVPVLATPAGELQPASAPPPLDGTNGKPAPTPTKPKESREWTDRHVDAMLGLLGDAKSGQPLCRDGVPQPIRYADPWHRVKQRSHTFTPSAPTRRLPGNEPSSGV